MDVNRVFDIIIVGAGPAGLSTALHLLQGDPCWGKSILILEKETHPRPKLCGGGITRSGLRILRDLGVALPLPLPQIQVNHALLQYRERTIHIRGEPLFVVIHRPEFDHFLAQNALERGIQVNENEAVLTLAMKPDHIQVNTTRNQYQAQVVVGADSARGPVRVWLQPGKNKGSEHLRIGRTLEILTPAEASSPRFKEQSALFDFSYTQENLQGYFWDFPSMVAGEPTHNRGIYDARFDPKRTRAQLTELLNKGLHSIGAEPVDSEVKSTPIRWLSSRQVVSGQRVLLVGDAAGVDGLFGEGISPALAYGKLAAAEIQRAFQKDNFNFDGYKQRLLRSSLGRNLFIRWLVAYWVYRFGKIPVFMDVLWTVGQFLARIWRAGPQE